MSTDWSACIQLLYALWLSPFSLLCISLWVCSCLPTLYLIPYVYPCLHLKPPFTHPPTQNPLLSPFLSPSGLMWDCKWSSLTSISGLKRSICVAQYQAGLSASPMLSHKGERDRQIKRPELLIRKQAAIIHLFIAHIYYTAWAANNNKCTSWSNTMPVLGPCPLTQTGLWNKSRVCMLCRYANKEW